MTDLPDYALAILRKGRELGFQSEALDIGASCYIPLQARTIKPRHKRKPVISSSPLFPGYAFVGMDRWMSSVRDLEGFQRLFSIDNEVVPIPAREIDRLKEREQDGEFKDHVAKGLTFKIGDYVRVVDGALQGYSGRVSNVLGEKYTIDVSGWKATVEGINLGPVIQSHS